MEKKYQIFISSTFKDLQKARLKVRDAILSMYHFPVGMEMFGALDEDNEARMYELLRILCPQATIVSVAHRLYLRKFHDKELVL